MFFTAIHQMMTESVDLTIVIRKTNGQLTVSTLPKSNGLKDEAQNHIVPLTVTGTPQELDTGFLQAVTRPIQKACGLISNMAQFEAQADKAAASSKAAKEAKSKETKEEREKREKYEKLMKKAEELTAARNHREAVSVLTQAKAHANAAQLKEIEEKIKAADTEMNRGSLFDLMEQEAQPEPSVQRKYSINSLVYWVTYVHNVVYSFYRSMIYCYINSTQRCAGSIVIDIIPTNGADKRKFFPFAPYFPVTNVIKRYFYPYFPAIIGIKGYSFPYFPYLSGIMKIKTALYSLFSRLDWHKTVVFPCLGEIYEGIRSLSWEIPVT